MAGKKGQTIKKAKCESKKFPEYYQLNYPEWTNEQCIEAAQQFKRSTNWRCIEYYQRLYPNISLEEQEKKRNEAIFDARKNNPSKIEYYIYNFPTISYNKQKELLDKHIREHNYQCIEFYQRLYPNLTHEEHLKMLNEKIHIAGEKISEKVSGELNGMHNSKTTELERKQISPKCIEFYERLYPNLSHEEHLEMLYKQQEKTNKSLTPDKRTTNIEYYLNKGYSFNESLALLKERQKTFTLEKCIAKYGEDVGTIKYKKRQEQWLKNIYKTFQINGDGRSKQSKFAKEIINIICEQLNIEIPINEHFIYDKEYKRAYAYDFTFNFKIIEFNGDYWHCNPRLYGPDFFNKVKQKTAKELWEYDKRKQEIAEYYHHKYLVIWEYDYKQNKEDVIKKCIDFLNS